MSDKSKQPPITPHSDRAFEQIHRANQAMRVLVVVALLIMTAMLGFGIVRLNQLYQTQIDANTRQQNEINERAKANRELLDKLTDNSRDTQYLICRIVTVEVPGRTIPDEITKICGKVIEEGASQSAGDDATPETRTDGPTSFLAPGSDTAAAQFRQPAQGSSANNQNQQGQQNATPPGSSNTNNEPAQTQPGLVDILQPALNELTPVACSAQQLLLNGCIIRP